MPNPTFSFIHQYVNIDTPLIFGVKKLRVNRHRALGVTLVTSARQVISIYTYTTDQDANQNTQVDRQVDVIFQKDSYIMVVKEQNQTYTGFGKLASVTIQHPVRDVKVGEKIGKKITQNN